MNKEVNFSRFVGIAIIVICIIIVVLALMSAIIRNENNDNIIYVDDGLGTMLSIPKSNIVTNYVDIQKDIQTENKIIDFNVKLPKINIETETTESINQKIYNIYKNMYLQISKDETIQKIDIDYSYDYLDDDKILEIIITKKLTRNNKAEETDIKYTYDIQNDAEI